MRWRTTLSLLTALLVGNLILLPRAVEWTRGDAARLDPSPRDQYVAGSDANLPAAHPNLAPSNAGAPLRTGPISVGQWVWTREDAALFSQSQSRLAEQPHAPQLRAAVWTGTIVATADGGARLLRANSPTIVDTARPVTIVLRLDDSVHRLWAAHDTAAMHRQLAPLVIGAVTEARATGVELGALQLDYDSPTRRLARWAHLVAQLREQPELAGLKLWVTSIPTHLQNPEYFQALAGVIDGHILQLFDTALPCRPAEVARITAVLSHSPLPFAVGVGAFERGNTRVSTEHACWVKRSTTLRELPGYRGHWIFPANHPYQRVLEQLAVLPPNLAAVSEAPPGISILSSAL